MLAVCWRSVSCLAGQNEVGTKYKLLTPLLQQVPPFILEVCIGSSGIKLVV